MNVKRMLALLLAAFVSVTAMSSILADGSVSGPEPKASDLPGDARDTVVGQWTMDELKAMDEPPVTGDAFVDDRLVRVRVAVSL